MKKKGNVTKSEVLLLGLTAVGPALAERIVEYRREHGEFETVEELIHVSGIGEAKLTELKDRVTVNGGDT